VARYENKQYEARCDVTEMPGNCGMAIVYQFNTGLPASASSKEAKDLYKGLYREIVSETSNATVIYVTDKVGGKVEKFAKAMGFTKVHRPVLNRHTKNNIVSYYKTVTKAEYEKACKDIQDADDREWN
jgi:hypothetical protein